MKLIVNQLCKERGMTLGQLADRMGVSLSNLSASINGNPSLKRLEDIAKNLGVEVSDLFGKPSKGGKVFGLVEIGGESFRITSAADWLKAEGRIPGLVPLHVYEKDSELLKDLKRFIHEGADRKDSSSLFGRFGAVELFTLSRTPQNEYDHPTGTYITDEMFTLSLASRNYTHNYFLVEYRTLNGYDIDSDGGLAMAIRNEIEAQLFSYESVLEEYGE